MCPFFMLLSCQSLFDFKIRNNFDCQVSFGGQGRLRVQERLEHEGVVVLGVVRGVE